MIPRLSILMPALAARESPMRPLIEAQIAGRDDAEFLVEVDQGEARSGAKRQRLLERARGEYVAFVDDDDEVADEYLEAILERCSLGPDVVTFELDFVRRGRVAETWSFGLHADDRRRGRMAANHLCAWRAELARRVGWAPIGYGDDQLWYGPLHASGLVRTEEHVPRSLYRYLWNPATTENQRPEIVRMSRRYFADGIPCYRDADGEIYVAIDGAQPSSRTSITAYRRGELATLPREKLEHFHTVRLA